MTRCLMTPVFFALVFLAVFPALPVRAESQSPMELRNLEDTISIRLDEIEKKQDQILQQLAAIKEELDVVKVRATLKG